MKPRDSISHAFQHYVAGLRRFPRLSADQELTLFRQYRESRDPLVRQELIVCHLRLVAFLARRHVSGGLPAMDLIGEGNVALVKAVDNFDPRFGIRFSTYAAWWIHRALRRSARQQRHAVRIPERLARTYYRWHNAAENLERALGRTPLAEEVAGALHLSQRQAHSVSQAAHVLTASVATQAVGGSVLTAMPDPRAESPMSLLVNHERQQELHRLLATLNPLAAEVLSRRYGLADGQPQSLEKVGQAMHLARESVRQIALAALNDLRGRLDPAAAGPDARHAGPPRAKRKNPK